MGKDIADDYRFFFSLLPNFNNKLKKDVFKGVYNADWVD